MSRTPAVAVLAVAFLATIGSSFSRAEADPTPPDAQPVTLASLLVSQPGKPGGNAGPSYTRAEDVIYGRRDGLTLPMDVFTPTGTNGLGVIICISIEYRSGRGILNLLHPNYTVPFLDRGYVVFAVMHSSQPRYTVSEAVDDVHRAVRFVKANAKRYGVDPDRLGITGGSAGGHLALLMGCAGRAGDPEAADKVDRQSSGVAAVASFFPPTDFQAFAAPPKEVAAAFDFREFDPAAGVFAPVTAERRRQIGKEISPVTHARKGSAPTLIMHGDADTLVPISQSEAMVARLKGCGVATDLIVKKGKGHLWFGIEKDVAVFADWFDRHLGSEK